VTCARSTRTRRREALHAVWLKNDKIRRQIDENAEKPTPTDVLGDE